MKWVFPALNIDLPMANRYDLTFLNSEFADGKLIHVLFAIGNYIKISGILVGFAIGKSILSQSLQASIPKHLYRTLVKQRR